MTDPKVKQSLLELAEVCRKIVQLVMDTNKRIDLLEYRMALLKPEPLSTVPADGGDQSFR